MTDPPSATRVVGLARNLDWPAIKVSGRRIAGECAYRGIFFEGFPQPAPAERCEAHQQLELCLLGAPANGKRRLENPTPSAALMTSPDELQEWIMEEWPFYGDLSSLRPAAATLARMPAPLYHAVVRETCVFSVGWDTGAWIGNLRVVDRHERPRFRVIALGASSRSEQDISRLIAHEAMHNWCRPASSGDAPPMQCALVADRFLSMARAHNWDGLVDDENEHRLCRAAELAWGL